MEDGRVALEKDCFTGNRCRLPRMPVGGHARNTGGLSAATDPSAALVPYFGDFKHVDALPDAVFGLLVLEQSGNLGLLFILSVDPASDRDKHSFVGAHEYPAIPVDPNRFTINRFPCSLMAPEGEFIDGDHFPTVSVGPCHVVVIVLLFFVLPHHDIYQILIIALLVGEERIECKKCGC